MASERRLLSEQCKSAALAAVVALGGTARRSDIRQHALEHGGFTAEDLSVPASTSRHDNLVDQYLSGALTWLKKDGVLFNVAYGVWSTSPAPEEPVEPDEQTYQRYLRSPEWQARRAQALEAAGHRCQMDKTHAGRLDVHHNTYDNLGDEQPGDLIVLCASCHMRHHRHEWNGKRQAPAAPEPVGPIDVTERHAELAPPRRRRWWSRAA